jgi:hypothetical protein
MVAVVRRRPSMLSQGPPLGLGLERELARQRDVGYWRTRRAAAAALRELRITKHAAEAGTSPPPAPEKNSSV